MIVLRIEVLREYLRVTGKNQNWMAEQMGYTKGYISQVLNNRCKVSAAFVEQILLLTHLNFEDLFYIDGKLDLREFYGEVFVHEGEAISKKRYYDRMRELASA